MATTNKDFRVKNGLIVDGATATVNGNTVLTNAASINALSDVTISSPSSGQVLKWNGTAWINDTDATGAGGGGNTFETISANGTSVVADSSTDTLTFTPGTGISIVGNATSDTVTFSVNGGLVPSGGTEGQVLLKTDGTDYNSYWADNSAESTFYLVRNNTGSTIVKGTLVSAYGAEPSGRIDVTPHETTGLQDSELRVMGVATANISNGVNGTVMSFGTLKGIDTRGNVASAIAVGDETWAEGDILYAHPTVAGKLTNVRPQHDLAVAFITVRHASSGQIAVRIIPGNHHLEWLHDVAIANTAANKDILQLNSSGIWVNANLATAGIANLSGATFTGNVAGTNISLSGNVNATTVNATTLIGNTDVATITGTTNGNITSLANLTTVGNIANGTWSANIGAVSGVNLTSLNAAQINSNTVPNLISTNLTSSILRLTATSDVNLTSTAHAFQIGADSAENLRLDANEIEALTNGAASTLNLNADGGTVQIGVNQGANLTVNGGISLAQQKNALVVSGYNSASGAFAQSNRVIMTATATGSADPTTRPDGTALQAGDIWIDW